MALPRTVTRVDRVSGVTFTNSVDRINYTINELCRAALRDAAKVLIKKMILKMRKLRGMKNNRRIYKNTQYWVRKRDADLQIGTKHDTWYGAGQELGTKNQPKRGIIRDTVFESIGEIREIQSKYLSAIEDENNAQTLINESEAISGDGEND